MNPPASTATTTNASATSNSTALSKSTVTSATTKPTQMLSNANIIRLPSTGQSIASSLASLSTATSLAGVSKTLGILGTNVKTNIKMAITQAAGANKTANIVTSPKAVTQIPIQLGNQMKNQHITLAALNQLTAGKLAGTQINTSGGKTVQIISPAKGQSIKQQLLGAKSSVNTPILTSVTSTGQTIKVVSSAVTSTTTTPSTQYALVRAQLPSTSGGPAQTVTFIRAIGPNTSSTSGSTTVSVTPQQMAALLKGQQNGGPTQMQKVLNAAGNTGGQLRAQTPINVASSLKLAAAQNSPSKLVSVQLPQKVGGTTQMKTVTVGSLLGGKVNTNAVTTQSTSVSPMATLVSLSGVKAAASTTSLVNQFPAVRPPSITVLTKTTATPTPTTVTNTDAVTSTTTPVIDAVEKKPSVVDVIKVDSTTDEAGVKPCEAPEQGLSDVDVKPELDEAQKQPISSTDIKEEPKDETGDAVAPLEPPNVEDEEKPLQQPDVNGDVPLKEAPTPVTAESEEESKDGVSSSTADEENKMEVDQDEKPASSNDKMNQEEPDQSSESVAASTLAQLASIASDSNTAMNDMSNPLSTLAALASSSPIAVTPIVNGTSKSGNITTAAKKVSGWVELK